MNESLHSAAVLPNRETATNCSPAMGIAAVMRAAHKLWRHDTRAKLRDVTKASERTVDYWRAKRRPQMSADHLVGLMRAAPAHFVPAVLGNEAYRELVREIIAQAKLEALEAQQAAVAQEIEQLRRGQ